MDKVKFTVSPWIWVSVLGSQITCTCGGCRQMNLCLDMQKRKGEAQMQKSTHCLSYGAVANRSASSGVEVAKDVQEDTVHAEEGGEGAA